MIFLKHFDTSKQTLFGLGKVYVSRNAKVGDLIPVINEKLRWTPGTPLRLYEVGYFMWHNAPLTTGIVGNQTRHDRTNETEAFVCTK